MRTAPSSSSRQLVANADAAVRAEDARGLIEWLLREGRFLPDNDALFSQFCERVVAAGIPLDRASLHLRALHARYRGVSRIWQPGTPLDQRLLDHGIEKTATKKKRSVIPELTVQAAFLLYLMHRNTAATMIELTQR